MDHQYIEEEAIQNVFNNDSDSLEKSETNVLSGFECNICLDLVQDPIVTLCGHLYCWPCIYKWISSHDENPDEKQPQCPVCKSEISMKMLIPLYGRGQSLSEQKSSNLGLIPQRPSSPSTLRPENNLYPAQPLQSRGYARRENYVGPPMSGSTTNFVDPMIRVFGEMVYARFFGNSQTTLFSYPNSYHLEGSDNPRLRRHMIQNDKSLSRICFFLCCCVVLCLILF